MIVVVLYSRATTFVGYANQIIHYADYQVIDVCTSVGELGTKSASHVLGPIRAALDKWKHQPW